MSEAKNDTMMLPEAKQWYNDGHAARGKTMIQWWTCCQRQNNDVTMMDMMPEAKQWRYNDGHDATGKTMLQWRTWYQKQNNDVTMIDMMPEAKQQWYNDEHDARGKTKMTAWRACCQRLPKQVKIKQWASSWWSSLSSLRLRLITVLRGAGIARWLEHRTPDWKVSGSNPCWNGGRIFFSRVDFLCWLLFRYPFHPRVTAVARKKSRSFCQKVQVAGYS